MAYIRINNGASTATVNNGSSKIRVNPWIDQSTILDDGYYNAFSMLADANGSSTVGMFKKASGHAPAGPMIFTKTTNGGSTWTNIQVTVDGNPFDTLNYSFIKLASGRMLICFRTEYTDGDITWAYSDDGTHNFITTQVTQLDDTDYNVYQSPTKMVETSFGKIFIVFYKVPTSTAPSEGVVYESADQGLTWTYKSTIFSHSSAVSNPTLGDWRANETTICETHPTGVEATSKFIAIARTQMPDIAGTYPQHYTSIDGGATWTTDLVNRDPGSFTDDNGVVITNNSPGFSRHLLYSFIGTNAPYDLRLHNGLVYIVCGERNRVGSNKYALKYTYATPDNAHRNKFDDWIRPIQVGPYYNAATLGASVDCGYPIIFKGHGTLFVTQYDTSVLAADPLKADTREFVEIQKLI